MKRPKVFITHEGETYSISEWSAKLGIDFETLRRRVRSYEGDIAKILNPNLKRGCPKGTPSWRKKYPSGVRIEYNAWHCMHRRCNDERATNYHRYGGRGIKVCAQWNSFKAFLTDMGRKPPHSSLDRINNDKGYSKSNCRWATKFEQENNRSNNVRVTFSGKTKTLAEWSRELNIKYGTLWHRHKKGLPFGRPTERGR